MQKQSVINIDHSINSGQVFLWERIQNTWYGINGHDVLSISEKPFKMSSFTHDSLDFFREDDDFSEIIQSISKDKIVRDAAKRYPGLRLLRQDTFQCYISFIVSSNSNIQKIRYALEELCKKFGKEIDFDEKKFYLFPEPETLENASIKELERCGLGYRAKSVKEASTAVVKGQINFEIGRAHV